MPHIKELKVHGFKSFAREIKIPFKNSMNVIVGPNGSGKSNITDAICFVLGRLGSKSMRAKKTSNLLFAGTQKYKPAGEASIEMIFDNNDGGFAVSEKEISIKRILRRNGQSIYKINGEIKTRQEIIELLGMAGIDPNGFNIVLQGEIDSFVKMSPDGRREVIEEVAGISVYEIRKQRSLAELEKTEQRLKEVGATLRERHAYLRNLEEERKQALHFKKLQEDVKNYKASIIHKNMHDKASKIEEIEASIKKEQTEIGKINAVIEKLSQEISVLNDKINHITENIQKASGLEQEKLNAEISDLRADIEGLLTRKNLSESKLEELKIRKSEIEENIIKAEEEIKSSSKIKDKDKEKGVRDQIIAKKKQLEEIDEKKRRHYDLKSKLASMTYRLDDKKKQIQKTKNEADFVLKSIEEAESGLRIKDNLEVQRENLSKLKIRLETLKREREALELEKLGASKSITVLETKIKELERVKTQIRSLDICPLCKTKMTKEHISKVAGEAAESQTKHEAEIESFTKTLEEISKKEQEIKAENEKSEEEIRIRNQDVIKLELINEKKQVLRNLRQEAETFEAEFIDMEKKKDILESQIMVLKTSDENYDTLMVEVQELERREEKNAGMEATFKQREIERMRNISKQAVREIEEQESNLEEIKEQHREKQNLLDDKNDQDRTLKEKYKKTFEEQNAYREKIRLYERNILSSQNNKHLTEDKMNNLKIERAQLEAQRQTSEEEAREFKDAVISKLPVEELKKKLDEVQRIIDNIGTVNMRSLEVYDGVKGEYEKIQEKVDILNKEKDEILKVIEDIDKKKKKVFLQTLEKINLLFSRNFSQLSTKGTASLEPVDPEKIFESGIEMLIKVGKGKYFDTHSLSGGEKSLISLSLIFAIQEYKPYSFYIFDEIDAALDRRNSERLAALLKRYMNNGQYIIITHNDSLITEAPVIYGVSMQDKISNVVSLEV